MDQCMFGNRGEIYRRMAVRCARDLFARPGNGIVKPVRSTTELERKCWLTRHFIEEIINDLVTMPAVE